MDNAYYEDLAGRLYGLVIRLGDRIPADSAGWVHHVTEVGKYELALEDLAAILAHGKTPITDQERADMLALGRKMTLRHDLAGVLGLARAQARITARTADRPRLSNSRRVHGLADGCLVAAIGPGLGLMSACRQRVVVIFPRSP